MMNEEIIKAAILEADSDYAKYGEDYTHSFSKKTEKKIYFLIKRELHPFFYEFKEWFLRVAVFIFVVGGAFLCINSSARAAVLSWIIQRYEKTVVYQGVNSDSESIKSYSIKEFVPATYYFSENDSYFKDNEICESYIDADGYYLYFYAIMANDGNIAQMLYDEGDMLDKIKLGGYEIDWYYDGDGNANAYVWHDNSGTLFYIGGHIGVEALDEITRTFIGENE